MEKQLLKKPNSVQMIDWGIVKLSDYSYPVTISSNWRAVIGYPRDCAIITRQIGARRTNHERVFVKDIITPRSAPKAISHTKKMLKYTVGTFHCK